MRRIIIVLLHDVEILDLGGPLQAFHEARLRGAPYEILFCASRPDVRTDQGLWLSRLAPLPEPRQAALHAPSTARQPERALHAPSTARQPERALHAPSTARQPEQAGGGEPDLVVVPGLRLAALQEVDPAVYAWLRRAHAAGADIASVCSGAFVLGAAGLLDGRQCTTHWRMTDEMQRRFPAARVVANRLFVTDGRITTSAGVASGIDMALALVERHHGPLLAAAAAREMVVYLRRNGAQRQESVYLDYRGHLHPGVHRVQDWLVANAGERATLSDLARIAALSPRHLTRVFRQATGISIHDYTTRLRLERAGTLLHDPALTVEAVAARCGYASARQLRRRWRQTFAATPSQARRRGGAAPDDSSVRR